MVEITLEEIEKRGNLAVGDAIKLTVTPSGGSETEVFNATVKTGNEAEATFKFVEKKQGS